VEAFSQPGRSGKVRTRESSCDGHGHPGLKREVGSMLPIPYFLADATGAKRQRPALEPLEHLKGIHVSKVQEAHGLLERFLEELHIVGGQ
jgi:hypothetical protein